MDRCKICKCSGRQTRVCEAGGFYREQVQCVPLTDSATDILRAVDTESHLLRNAHHTDFLRFSRALFFTLLSLGLCKKVPFFLPLWGIPVMLGRRSACCWGGGWTLKNVEEV